MHITLYAGAAAAAGVDRLDLDVQTPLTADELRARLSGELPTLAPVVAVSSLLVEGQAVHDGDESIPADASVDVLPPFAGGLARPRPTELAPRGRPPGCADSLRTGGDRSMGSMPMHPPPGGSSTMQISSTPAGSSPSGTPITSPTTNAASATAATRTADTSSKQGFSVLNDFRYLSSSDKDLIGQVTGEIIDPAYTEKATPASQFALQLALDRRTGQLQPHQDVTAVYLQNRSHDIDKLNAGRPHARNPYSGQVLDDAVKYLHATGRGRADIRL